MRLLDIGIVLFRAQWEQLDHSLGDYFEAAQEEERSKGELKMEQQQPRILVDTPAPARPWTAVTLQHQEIYTHAKNVKKGSERLDRRSGRGVRGEPKKSGHGGKFTWDGPASEEDLEEDVVIALDENDPNYVEEPELEETEVRSKVLNDDRGPGIVEPKIKELEQ
ncbi:hypothetical protein R1sor_007034 [Riccia sorocarpa]|uniref:Uncharacterized protein n=1 Tax=Riccia sorocarpa TaxID=122646 RepID=A0ABD3HPQ2_9MARC